MNHGYRSTVSTDIAHPAAVVAGCAGTADTDALRVAARAVARFVGAVVSVYAAHGIALPDLGGDSDA